MTPKQVSRVWTVVSLALLYYALNSYLVIQGGNEIFGAKLVTSNKNPAAMVAVIVCSVLLCISSGLGIEFARSGGKTWADRIPLVGLDALDASRLNARIYQGFMLFALSVLPALSLIHFWRTFAGSRVATTDSPPKPVSSIWDWGALTSLDNPASICATYAEGPPVICEKKMTLLPGLEPSAFAVVTGFAAILTLAFWVIVFRPMAKPNPASAAEAVSNTCIPAECRSSWNRYSRAVWTRSDAD